MNVFAAFSYDGTLSLLRLYGSQKSIDVKGWMQEPVIPMAQKHFDYRHFILQHDKARNFKQGVMKPYLERLEEQGWITMLDWSAQSPDLNPIENVFMKLDYDCKRRTPKNAQQFFDIIQEAWHKLGFKTVCAYVESMQLRCQAVIDADGYHINN